MEFQLRQENVSVVIMPLPFVHTARSIGNLKPKKGLMFEPGIPSKVRHLNMTHYFANDV